MRAVAPPGGCKVWVRYITRIDNPTDIPIVKKLVPKHHTKMTAMHAEIRCPPMRFLGWERGASGTANNNTAVAPKDPMRRGCPENFVMSKIDHMDTVLLTKLQIAKR